MLACFFGCANIVSALLKVADDKNINIHATDNGGCTAFQWACLKKKIDVVQLLLKSGKIDVQAETGQEQEVTMNDNDGTVEFQMPCGFNKDQLHITMDSISKPDVVNIIEKQTS